MRRGLAEATPGQELLNNLLFPRFFRHRGRILPLRDVIGRQQVIHVEAVLGVFHLTDHRVIVTPGLQRLMPVTLQGKGFTLTAGVALQTIFDHLLLSLHGPAQLLLTHLVMGFLQIAAELLADSGSQRRHHDQQDQYHQQRDAFLFT